MSDNDGGIVDAVLSGRTESYSVLVQRYERALNRLAVSRLGDCERARDAVQETFLSAFKSLHTYDSRYSFRTWLWTILINQCRRQLRSATRFQREQPDADLDKRPSRSAPAADACLIAGEQSAQMETALRELPDNWADALRLRFFGELTYPEIAGVMNIGLTSAKNYVRRGLLEMSNQLVDESSVAQMIHHDAEGER